MNAKTKKGTPSKVAQEREIKRRDKSMAVTLQATGLDELKPVKVVKTRRAT